MREFIEIKACGAIERNNWGINPMQFIFTNIDRSEGSSM